MKTGDIRSGNKINLLRLLYKKNRSRAELARELGLSKSAVSGLIAELEEQNLVTEVGRGESSEVGGKKPIILSVNRDAGSILSVHFDDALCGVSVTDMMGDVTSRDVFEISIHDDPAATLAEMAGRISAFLGQSPRGERLLACGVSVKGLVDSDRGVLTYTSSNPNWRDVPLGDYFSRLSGVHTFVDNDARAIMCLDAFSRPDEEMDVVGCISIESGVGTSVMIGNNILKGAFFGAVNFGHTAIDPQGPLCKCGQHGCWEAHVSTDALVGKARALPGRSGVTYADVVRLYRSGDEEVARVLTEDYGRWIGVGIANYSRIFNPRRLVIYVDDELFDARLQERILQVVHGYENQVTAKSKIRFAPGGPLLHLRAAAALAIRHFLSTAYHDLLMRGAA